MGNWRTVNITGTFEPAEADDARWYLAVNEDWRPGGVGPLSISDALCSLREWPAPTVMAAGNLYERDYSVQDVADHCMMMLLDLPVIGAVPGSPAGLR